MSRNRWWEYCQFCGWVIPLSALRENERGFYCKDTKSCTWRRRWAKQPDPPARRRY